MGDEGYEPHPRLMFWKGVPHYKGKDPKRQEEVRRMQNLAGRLQRAVNKAYVEGTRGMMTTSELMDLAGVPVYDKKDVDVLVVATGGGSNHVMI